MDPVPVVNSVSTALGENSDTVDAMLRDLFRAFSEAGSYDWAGVQQILSARPVVEDGKAAALLDALKALAGEAGGADDPRIVFDDHDLRGYFQPAGTPVAGGSLISRVGDAYYLGHDHQVWQAGSGDSVYYHDGTQNYDSLGRPLKAPRATFVQ